MKLFDLDGTLIDSNGVWVEIDSTFLARRGLAYTREYSDAIAHSVFHIAAAFTKEYYHLRESAEEIMAEWLAMARDHYDRLIPLKPGAAAFLEQEFRKGEPLVIVTACVPELCHAVLARHGLTHYFQRFFFARDLDMEKRDPRFFPLVVKELGLTPSECTMYEDAPENCAAAKAAGLAVVGVQDDFYARHQPRIRDLCDGYIMSFEELLI